jgi:integrase
MTKGPTAPTPLKLVKHHGYRSHTTTWYDANGTRRTKRFGKETEVTKKRARAAYDAWLKTQWLSKPSVRTPGAEGMTVADLARKYAEHCRQSYRTRGEQSTHFSQIASAMNALIDRYGVMPASSLGAPEITQLRDAMVHSRTKHPMKHLDQRPLSISTVNGRLRIIKQMFAWARNYGWVSRESVFDVALAKPLRAGRSDALPVKYVKPVPADILQTTVKHCPKTIADMIWVLYWTGMRSGELIIMRPCDIDTRSKDVWLYRPRHHKTEHRGKSRIVPIGPKAQAILKLYIEKRKINEVLFTPSDAHRERLLLSGKNEVIAYQMSRSVFKPGREYTNDTFRNAVQRACDRAWDPKGTRRASGDYSHRWHPHQLRHNAATRIREEMGIEAASDVLGHSSMNTSLIYAERSTERMKEIARRVG